MGMRVLASRLPILVAGLWLAAAPAQAAFVLCNKTPLPVRAAMAFDEKGSVAFSGWLGLAAQTCAPLVSSLSGIGRLYLYAYSEPLADGTRLVWRGENALPDEPLPPQPAAAGAPFHRADWLSFIAMDVRADHHLIYDLTCEAPCGGQTLDHEITALMAEPEAAAPYRQAAELATAAGDESLAEELRRLDAVREAVAASHDPQWQALMDDYARNIAGLTGPETKQRWIAHLRQRIAVNRAAIDKALDGGHAPLAAHYGVQLEEDLGALEDISPDEGAAVAAEGATSVAQVRVAAAAWRNKMQEQVAASESAMAPASGAASAESVVALPEKMDACRPDLSCRAGDAACAAWLTRFDGLEPCP